METISFTFLSSDLKTNIQAFRWLPKNSTPDKILQISHGMQEFIERYIPFIKYLTENNFLVVGNDHLGHGASVKNSESWGYFGDPYPSDLVVGDMHKLRNIIQEEYPSLPYFILGHSMGSYMLRKYLSFYSDGLAGAIIMGTGFESTCTTSMAMKICSFVACFRGWKYRSSTIANMAMGGGAYKQFDSTGKNKEKSWLTKDIKIVEQYFNEPKCTFTFTLNGFLGLFEAVNFSCNVKNVEKINKDLPILIVSGKDDPVGDLGKGVQTVYDIYNNSKIKDLEMKLYEGDRHEILNELDKEVVYNDIKEWIIIRCQKFKAQKENKIKNQEINDDVIKTDKKELLKLEK